MGCCPAWCGCTSRARKYHLYGHRQREIDAPPWVVVLLGVGARAVRESTICTAIDSASRPRVELNARLCRGPAPRHLANCRDIVGVDIVLARDRFGGHRLAQILVLVNL